MANQISIGWGNSHLHQFIKNKTFYVEKYDEDWKWDENPNVDFDVIVISYLFVREREKIEYEHDFGNGWVQEIKLGNLLPNNHAANSSICTGGALGCPPEDYGGICGY